MLVPWTVDRTNGSSSCVIGCYFEPCFVCHAGNVEDELEKIRPELDKIAERMAKTEADNITFAKRVSQYVSPSVSQSVSPVLACILTLHCTALHCNVWSMGMSH